MHYGYQVVHLIGNPTRYKQYKRMTPPIKECGVQGREGSGPERGTHLATSSGQHAEPEQHGRDADEQLQHQEDDQGAQDPIDQQLARDNPQQQSTGDINLRADHGPTFTQRNDASTPS